MIARESQSHHGADCGPAVDGYDAVGDRAHGENRGLRRGNDGAEGVHVIHAEVADGEGGVGKVGGTQLPGTRPLGHVAAA